jgi:hypothetical protein
MKNEQLAMNNDKEAQAGAGLGIDCSLFIVRSSFFIFRRFTAWTSLRRNR